MSFFSAPADAVVKVPQARVKHEYKKRQTGVLIATCITYAGYYIIRQVVQDEQVPIRREYGFSIAQIGLILSMFGIGYGISKLFMGFVADRVHGPRFLALGLYVSCVVNLLFAWNRNFYVMLVLMLVLSVSQAIGAPVCQREISLWFSKKSRGASYSTWSAAHNFGAFFCVVSIEAATAWFSGSLPAVFITASVVSAIIATAMLIINSDRPEAYGLPDINTYSDSVELNENGATTAGSVTKKSLWKVFTQDVLTNKMVWAVSLTSMSFYIIRYGVLSWIPSYLPAHGFSVSLAKWIVGYWEISLIPSVIFFGWVSDRLKGRRALVTFWLTIVMIIALIFYFTSPNKTVIIVALFVAGGCIYAPLDLVGLMVNEAVPKYAVGLSTGFMGFFQYIFGETIATALIGELVNKYGWGSCGIVLYCAAGLCLVIVIYLVFQERKILKMEERANSLSAEEKAALEDPEHADAAVLASAAEKSGATKLTAAFADTVSAEEKTIERATGNFADDVASPEKMNEDESSGK